MTHTNHRQGTIESLREDWVVMIRTEKGINNQNCSSAIKKFAELSLEHDPVSIGTSKIGTSVTIGRQELMDELDKTNEDASPVHVVFDSVENVAKFLKDLVKADLGLSIIVSGLHAETDRICREAGTRRHTVQHSLGVWGKTDLLPHPKILEVTTMCGHGMLPFNLVRRMANAVSKGTISLEQASVEIAKPCACGVVNTRRAQNLIQEYIACDGK